MRSVMPIRTPTPAPSVACDSEPFPLTDVRCQPSAGRTNHRGPCMSWLSSVSRATSPLKLLTDRPPAGFVYVRPAEISGSNGPSVGNATRTFETGNVNDVTVDDSPPGRLYE